jgi:hypothetical protein
MMRIRLMFMLGVQALSLPLPACGERVGVRGILVTLGLAESPPHPPRFAWRPLPAQRGEVTALAALTELAFNMLQLDQCRRKS